MESFTINICEVKAAMVIEKEPNDGKLPTGESLKQRSRGKPTKKSTANKPLTN